MEKVVEKIHPYQAPHSDFFNPVKNLRYKQIFVDACDCSGTYLFIVCSLGITIISLYLVEALERYMGRAPVSPLYDADCLLEKFNSTPDCIKMPLFGVGITRALNLTAIFSLAGIVGGLAYGIFKCLKN